MRNGYEMNKVDSLETVKAHYFCQPELDSIIKEKGICSHKYLLNGQVDKPYWAKQNEKEERNLGIDELAPVHAFIIPPQLIGTDIGNRIFLELTRQYGDCVKSFDLQVENALYLMMKDPDYDVEERVVTTQDLLRLLAVSSSAAQRTSNEPLFKWLVKALVLVTPITDWQEVKRSSYRCEIPMYTILAALYAVAVLAYGYVSEEVSVPKDNFGTAIIAFIVFMTFAFFAIAVLVETWVNVSNRGMKNFCLPVFCLLAFAATWLGLFGLFELQIYFLYFCGLLMAMTVWIFTSGRVQRKK